MAKTKRSLMFVGAHADDIELWAGGACLKYHQAGYAIDYIMSTNNMSGQLHFVEPDGRVRRESAPPRVIEPIRKRECDKACKVVGAEAVHLEHPQRHYIDDAGRRVNEGYGVPPPQDVSADRPVILMAHEDPDSVARLAALVLERNPEAVLTHPLATESPEHYATALLVRKAVRDAAKAGYAGSLLYWCESFQDSLFGGTSLFSWDTFVDVSDFLQQKFDFVRCHETMIPLPERMDFTDYSPWCGCAHAEPFSWVVQGTEGGGAFTAELRGNFRTTTTTCALTCAG